MCASHHFRCASFERALLFGVTFGVASVASVVPCQGQCGPQFVRDSSFANANRPVSALVEFQGDLVAAGAFSTIGGVPAARVARWNGVTWTPMGGGLGVAPATSEGFMRLAVVNGELFAGGLFTTAQGAPVNSLAKWNGATWEGVPAAGGPNWGGVTAMTAYNNRLYASGDSSGLRQWSGTAWNLVDSFSAPFISAARANVLTTYAGALIVAGPGMSFSGTPHYIARWTSGNTSQPWFGTWAPLGTGLATSFSSAAEGAIEYQSELYVTGLGISSAGGVPNTASMAKWNGLTWSSLGSGTTNGYVAPPWTYAGDLYVSGSATQFVGFSAPFVARRNTSGWVSTPGLSTNGAVLVMLAYKGELIMGGNFTLAGGASSTNLARWTMALTPWVAIHPTSTSVPAGTGVNFSSTIARGYAASSATWELESAPGSNSFNPLSSGPIAGSMATATVGPLVSGVASLSITDPDTVLSGRRVRAVFQTGCGSATSNPGMLTVTALPPTGACCLGTTCAVTIAGSCSGIFQGNSSVCGTPGNPTTCCPVNFNAVAGVSVQDVFDFLTAWFANDPRADFNGVGGISVQDVFDYLTAWFQGC